MSWTSEEEEGNSKPSDVTWTPYVSSLTETCLLTKSLCHLEEAEGGIRELGEEELEELLEDAVLVNARLVQPCPSPPSSSNVMGLGSGWDPAR